MGFKQRTDRLVLGRLNVLLALFSLYQVGSAVFLLVVLVAENLVDRTIPPQIGNPVIIPDNNHRLTISSSFWNLNSTMGVTGLIGSLIFISNFLTWRVVRYVNLVGSIKYWWALTWALSFEAFCVVGLIDYFRVTSVWVKHW